MPNRLGLWMRPASKMKEKKRHAVQLSNVLLSFAQFEREVTGERIRDKIAASKQKGMWMGGLVPIGYDVIDRRLVVNQTEAEMVQEIFRRYLELGSVRPLMEDLNRRGIRSKVRVARNGNRSGGNLFFRGALYELLSNPIYIGEIRHKGVRHPGLHEPIVDRELWDSTQLMLQNHAAPRAPRARKSAASPLTGKLFDESGQSLTPSHAVKGERRYRYYVSRNLINGTSDSGRRGWRLPAPEIERAVASAAYTILSDDAAIANAAREGDTLRSTLELERRAARGQWRSGSFALAGSRRWPRRLAGWSTRCTGLAFRRSDGVS